MMADCARMEYSKYLAAQAMISPDQYMILLKCQLYVLILSKFLGKKSSQPVKIRMIPYHLIWHLMTRGIPKQLPARSILQKITFFRVEKCEKIFAVVPSMHTTVLTECGMILNRTQLTHQECRKFIDMEFHQSGQFFCIIDSSSNVWLGKNISGLDCPISVQVSIANSQETRATKCTFDALSNTLFIGYYNGIVKILQFSENLDCISRLDPSCISQVRDIAVINDLDKSNIICGIVNNSCPIKIILMNRKFEIICDTTVDSIANNLAISICFSKSDSTLFITGHRDGSVSFWRIIFTGKKILISLICSQKFLDTAVSSIKQHPTEPSIFASVNLEHNDLPKLVVWQVSPDFKRHKIIKTFYASVYSFYGPFLLIGYQSKISLLLVKNETVYYLFDHYLTNWNHVRMCVLDMKNSAIFYTDSETQQVYKLKLKGLLDNFV
jgi:hypothetical protein